MDRMHRSFGKAAAFMLVLAMVFTVWPLTGYAARDTKRPTRPALSVVSVTQKTVQLKWKKSTDNKAVASYRVYKNGRCIATVKGTTYTVKGLKPSTTYKFYVKAKDTSGNLSYAGNTVKVKTLAADTKAPTAPTGLKASGITVNSLCLSWQAATDNVGVKTYIIYKNGVKTASVSGTGYTVTGLAPNAAYSFYVKAADAAGNVSAAGNTLRVTTLPQKIVSGYYASWATYSGYTPLNVPAGNLTHLVYAFANIGDDLKVEMGDPDADPANFSKLAELKKKYPALKTLISVGGWDWSGLFSDASLTDASRTDFAKSAVAFMKQYGFDGVDIDWEYPCGGGDPKNISRPADKTNFTLLMAKLRQTLDAAGAADGKHYLLAFAGSSGKAYAANTELNLLANYVDYANVMTYDIHGTWDDYTDLNAPLYTPKEVSPEYQWSCDSAVKLWLSKGFPASRLVMGVPFYGYRFNAVTNAGGGLYQSFSGGESVAYDKIASLYLTDAAYIRTVHADAKVPYLFNGSVFISYDDAQSIAQKAAYIKAAGIAGASIWELSQNADGTLLNTLYTGLK